MLALVAPSACGDSEADVARAAAVVAVARE